MSVWQASLDDFLQNAKQPLIVVLGPTASGKTDFSLEIADVLRASSLQPEVVNADSRQLYRHLDVGTAKIKPEEMREVPHHLIDVLDVDAPVSIAWFKQEALPTIDGIQERGGVPLLVGGSMLYISSIIDGLEPLPAVDPETRSSLEAAYDQDDGVTLFARLQELDPVVAAGIDRKNKRYLVRALELIDATGKSITEQRTSSACPYDLLVFGIRRPRSELVERINARTEDMFARGWVDEVERMRTLGYRHEHPGMQSHGYREVLQWIEQGKQEKDFAALAERIAANTRQYAKRQMTWWNPDARIEWIDL